VMADLVSGMVGEYQSKKKGKVLRGGRITRGRSVSISSSFETRMAHAVLRILPADFVILIDTPLSYHARKGARKKTLYPDLMLIKRVNAKQSRLMGIIELKIDLGWLADGWATKRRRLWRELATVKDLTIKENPLVTGKLERKKLIPVFTVVLTEQNDHRRWKKFEREHNGRVCSILDKSYPHPNDPKCPTPHKLKKCLASDEKFENRIGILYDFVESCGKERNKN
jgi:hypothetical protein